MTLAEFLQALAVAFPGRYVTGNVKATIHHSSIDASAVAVEWTCYVSDIGWTAGHPTAQGALDDIARLAAAVPTALPACPDLDAVGAPPSCLDASTPAPFAPPPSGGGGVLCGEDVEA